MDIKIRKATQKDIPELTKYLKKLMNKNFPGSLRSDKPITSNVGMKWFKANSKGKSFVLLAINEEKKIVGQLNFVPCKIKQMSHGGELGVSVDRNYRRQGIGTLLFKELEERLTRKREIKRLELSVLSSNKKAMGLYRKMGFKQEGIKLKAVKHGRIYLDIIFMAKWIGR